MRSKKQGSRSSCLERVEESDNPELASINTRPPGGTAECVSFSSLRQHFYCRNRTLDLGIEIQDVKKHLDPPDCL